MKVSKYEIIDNLKASKFYSRLQQLNTVAIILTGSCALDLVDEHSDFDISIIVDDDLSQISPSEFLVYKDGTKVHWYYNEYKRLLDCDIQTLSDMICSINLSTIKDETIIDVIDNDKFQDILNNKDKIARCGIIFMIETYYKSILDMIRSQEKIKKFSGKILYRVLYAAYLLLNKKIDTDFLIRIKRKEYNALNDSDLKQCSELLQEMIEHYSTIKEEL